MRAVVPTMGAALAAAAAVAFISTLQLVFTVFPYFPHLAPRGAALVGLFAFPGLAAGFVWAVGSRAMPRLRPAILAVALIGLVILVAWATIRAVRPRDIIAMLLYLPPRLTLHKALLVIIVILASAFGLWLGALTGRRVPRTASRMCAGGIAALSIVALAAAAWMWPLYLFPERAIGPVVTTYISARMNGRYQEAVACFAPDYLRRVFGPPPYEPKFREALHTQLHDLRAVEREWCGAMASMVRPVPGTRNRRATIWYHYHGEAPQIHISWYYDMTFRVCRRSWRIADMRLDRKRSEEIFKGLRLGEGPCGTGRILRLPPDLQAQVDGWDETRGVRSPALQ